MSHEDELERLRAENERLRAALEASDDKRRLDWLDAALDAVAWSQKSWVMMSRNPVIVNASPGSRWCGDFARTHATLREAIDAEMKAVQGE